MDISLYPELAINSEDLFDSEDFSEDIGYFIDDGKVQNLQDTIWDGLRNDDSGEKEQDIVAIIADRSQDIVVSKDIVVSQNLPKTQEQTEQVEQADKVEKVEKIDANNPNIENFDEPAVSNVKELDEHQSFGASSGEQSNESGEGIVPPILDKESQEESQEYDWPEIGESQDDDESPYDEESQEYDLPIVDQDEDESQDDEEPQEDDIPDENVPLYLSDVEIANKVKSGEMFHCIYCGDNFPLFCDHYQCHKCKTYVCDMCMNWWIKAKIGKRRFALVCSNCNYGYNMLKLNFLIKPHLLELLDKRLLQNFVNEHIDEYIYCPGVDCPFIFAKPNDKNICSNICPGCSSEICVQCGQLWTQNNKTHDNYNSCEEFRKKILEKDENRTLEETFKNCPKCKVQIEKRGGCRHMTCWNCSYNFCWFCASYILDPDCSTCYKREKERLKRQQSQDA